MTVKRTTQVVAESLSTSVPKLRASQIIAEVLSQNDLDLILTQVVVEMLSENVADDVAGGNMPIQMVTAT